MADYDDVNLKVVEATASGAIKLPDGRRIDALVQVPTTDLDYGGEDGAAMLADTIARVSQVAGEAEQAYESGLEQINQDWKALRLKMEVDKHKATKPMLEVFLEYDAAGVLIRMHVLTVWGYAPWDPNLKPRIDTIDVDEMDRVILAKEHGIQTVIGAPTFE